MQFYFFIGDHQGYDDAAVYLAEGLRARGISFHANRNFWRPELDAEWLFRSNPSIRPQDCDVVVISTYWFHYLNPTTYMAMGMPMPDGLLAPDRQYVLVLLDAEDGYRTTGWRAEFRAFDLVLRCKYNCRTFNWENYRPWVLGFGDRVTRATAGAPPFAKRHRTIVANFGFTHKFAHGIRKIASRQFLTRVERDFPLDRHTTDRNDVPRAPWDKLMWEQTEGKHYPAYYRQLRESQCVACFCGEMAPPTPYEASSVLCGGRRAWLRRRFHELLARFRVDSPRIIQWDSWRFWECLVAGSVAIHVDLEKYGALLPVMPVNWQHYIGIDFDHLDRDRQRFLALDTAALERIAVAGHTWALQHYAPPVAADRLIQWCSNLNRRSRPISHARTNHSN